MSDSSLPAWDLSDLYPAPDAPALLQDKENAQHEAGIFAARYGKEELEHLDGDALAGAIDAYAAIQETLAKLSSYAFLSYCTRMDDPEAGRFYQDIMEHVNTVSTKLLFFTLRLNLLEDKALEEKYAASDALVHYHPWLRDLRVMRPYQLSEELEELLHEKQITGAQSWNRLFDETLAGLRFDVKDVGDGLTLAETLDLLSSADAARRKAAAKALGHTLGDHSRQFALITNTLAKDKEIEDRWRNLPAPISARNLANLVEDEVVEALLETVEKNYARLSHRYYRLKATWFGVETLPYWDRNAPLPFDDEKNYGWEEAVKLVLDAYHRFSPELAKLGERFFANAWIDAPLRPGKESGAFAHPTVPSAHPYLLLNFQGKTRDVMTLAHELGHGVHQLLAAKQGFLMADTPLTLAETASVFGEQLTFQELLSRESDARRRAVMIAGKVEDMLNTVVRQTAFCGFERRLHARRRRGEIPAEEIGAIWMEVQKNSLGPAITFEEEYRHYWAYIPHFIHTPFYVYAYAFGDCLVNALYARYQQAVEKGESGFQDRYLALLEAGGTLRHKELLAPFGLDASDPAFWQQGLDIISTYIDELEEVKF